LVVELVEIEMVLFQHLEDLVEEDAVAVKLLLQELQDRVTQVVAEQERQQEQAMVVVEQEVLGMPTHLLVAVEMVDLD
jgi:hypothetical protein